MKRRIRHLNCGTLRPLSARLTNGRGSLVERGEMVCHCLLVEQDDALVLVDAGIGQLDIDRRPRAGAFFDLLAEPAYDPLETAARQVEALGYRIEEVKDIVLTHLDFDHAGGLADFPFARVHVSASELRAATRPATLQDRWRYIPDQWAHGVSWQTYGGTAERWFELEGAAALDGLPGFWLVPLPGHSRGHCGVALETERGWLLHCGDAYYDRGQVDPRDPHCPIGSALFQRISLSVAHEHAQSLEAIRRLLRYHSTEVLHLSSHDPAELEMFRGAW
ncbi:MAG: MBL fold metallo-hydrolase [Myxococcales bacterium]|nr:MBL fold metallo-hydrolase [Myxococcales bacterium]